MTSSGVHRWPNPSPKLHYVEYPADRPTLLLLHGVARNRTDWEALVPSLVNDWHVIALDQRGHGQSERVPHAYRVIDYALDAGEFVRAHCASPVTVMGHSLGAMVALWLAAECEESIARVVLEDPPFHTMGRRIAETLYQAQFAGMQRVAVEVRDDLEAITDALGDLQLPSRQGTIRLGDLRERSSLRYSAECLRQVDPDIFSPIVAGKWLDGFEHEALWSRVTCPVLLLQGDPRAGGAFSDADVKLARDRLAQHHYVRFDGVGHQIHRTRPDQFIAALTRFSR